MIRRHGLLTKRLLCLILAAALFYQWISFSMRYGTRPYNNHHASSYDHLFHNDKAKLKLEIEQILKGSEDETPPGLEHKVDYTVKKSANFTFDLSGLEVKLGDDWHWKWIFMRIKQLWAELCEAVVEIDRDYPSAFKNRTMLRILVLPGVLSLTDFAHPERAFHGGPVGELTQWADLIAILYLLGHQLELRWDIRYAGIDLGLQYGEEGGQEGCASNKYDLIYTDLGGHSNLPDNVKSKYRLKFRVLDAFGSEVMYNVPDYAKAHGIDRSAGKRDLYIKQFFTMYPEVPDNSFAGFIISKKTQQEVTKENSGILYGKELNYIRGKRQLITSLRPFMELHATLPQSKALSENGVIINHGVVQSDEYRRIVNKAKYFIGMGDPIEGPGMLEAVARGCVVLQPLFKRDVKLHGKPNNRTITSQVPYLERIGPPHVYTVDYDNITEILQIIKDTQKYQVSPFLPVEFSAYGYIQRLNAYLEKQVYCGHRPRWPPDRELRVKVASFKGQSCSDVCDSNNLVCENAFFDSVNSTQVFTKLNIDCASSVLTEDVYVPAYIPETRACLFQNNSRLFSCASYMNNNAFRICPCRTFMKQQRALCEQCL